MFAKDCKTVILMKKGQENDVEQEKYNKNQRFSKNLLLRGLVHQNLSNWIRFILTKDEIHTLSNDLRRNLYNGKPYSHEFEEVLTQLFS
jgi:hypothetical protein